jgi:hypothetical protein
MSTSTAIVPVTDEMYIELRKEGEPINLNEYPSLLAMLHARQRALRALDEEIEKTEASLVEKTEALQIKERLGMRVQGLRGAITRAEGKLERLARQRDAIEANYLEVPRLPASWLEIAGNKWGEALPNDVPLDVLKALEHAYESDLFDEFLIYLPEERGRDPMIVGIAGDAYFYIASWR